LQIFKDLGMTEMTENPPTEHNNKGIRRAISDLLFARWKKLSHIPRRTATKNMTNLGHR